ASAAGYANQLAGFRTGLRDLGYVEGTNVVVDDRWAQGHYERLPGLVADLVRSNVDVIVTHGTPGALAAKQATTTVPIVMAIVGGPVASGIVASLAQPGGNITGQSCFNPELGAKKIELLKEPLPHMTRAACLLNPDNPGSIGLTLQAMEDAAKSLKMELHQFAVLIGYGGNHFATFRQAAVFVDKILKGTKPADLPIEQATTFDFVLNLKTANALGLTVPLTLLVRADEVIE